VASYSSVKSYEAPYLSAIFSFKEALKTFHSSAVNLPSLFASAAKNSGLIVELPLIDFYPASTLDKIILF